MAAPGEAVSLKWPALHEFGIADLAVMFQYRRVVIVVKTLFKFNVERVR